MQRRLDARGWSPADLARAIRSAGGSGQESTISRWKREGAAPTFELVRAVAEAFDEPVYKAVVATGLLTEQELADAGIPTGPPDPTDLPDEVLVGEVLTRLAARRPPPAGAKPRRRRTTAGNGAARRAAGDRTVLAVTDDPDSTTVPVSDPTPGGRRNDPPPSGEDEGSGERIASNEG